MSEKYTNIKVEKNEQSEVIITGDITTEASTKFRTQAIKEITKNIEVPGFRKGHVPENVVVTKVGEAYILEEAAELALKEVTPQIIEKNAPDYIGRPKIEITKLAPANPIGFKITVGITPTFSLPDYKKIASKETSKKDEPTEISEKEIDDVVTEIRKRHAHNKFHHEHADEQGHDHSDEAVEKHMPEWNDEFVKSIGTFDSIADFRVKARENLTKEKEQRNIEKNRGTILESLVKETEIILPPAIVEAELDRMFAQFEADIRSMGLKVEDYLGHIKKTPEELRKDWVKDAEKRAKINLLLAEIAKKENITPDKDAMELEVKRILEQFNDVDPIRVSAYVTHMLTTEKVIQFLESQK
jgi:trigger factor